MEIMTRKEIFCCTSQNPPVMQDFVLLNPYKMRNTMFNYLTNNCFIASRGFNRKKKKIDKLNASSFIKPNTL